MVIRNLKVPRFESDLVPHWVLDDGTSGALIHRLGNQSQSTVNISVSSHASMMKGVMLMEQLFINDLMGIFHFTDGYNTPLVDQNGVINNNPTNTDT